MAGWSFGGQQSNNFWGQPNQRDPKNDFASIYTAPTDLFRVTLDENIPKPIAVKIDPDLEPEPEPEPVSNLSMP